MTRQTLENRVFDAMALLTRATEDFFERVAGGISPGLRRGTASPLFVLHRAGPLRVSQLAEELGLDRTTVTRHLDDLESRGLVARQPDERDRRAMVASLTPAAQGFLDDMRVRNRALIRRICADWTREERAMFGVLLPRFATEGKRVFGSVPTSGTEGRNGRSRGTGRGPAEQG
ncbi:MarR family winged helix-turn-helix transcriptional regulator [Kibdelosporangium persicum]|uniref:DNA-binding transcriptional regulator, MarR family n=1 Tax=Kibdelosporangium persicum TaxID=2698649 RepID=A0ABX2F7M6_9PSEU|nr:MarR family transcriptional regulator [Kibdelosporangium persicum]NRN67359.1 DNA-binding transcriptional regulator, MarR family [Kibdelosporangium persicum]